jgi:hypothetical protein
MEAQEKKGVVLRTWDASDEVSIGIFLFLPVPSFIVVQIMCARGCRRCDSWCTWVAFFALSLVGRGRNGGRCWLVAGVGIVLLRDEGADKFVISS